LPASENDLNAYTVILYLLPSMNHLVQLTHLWSSRAYARGWF